MRIKLLFITVALFVVVGSSYGQLLQWNTFGNTGTETNESSVFNEAHISPTDLTFGAGVTPAANGNRFGGSGWFNTGNTTAGNTLTEAIAGNDYIQFVVIPNSGYSFTPTSFVFSWDRSSTGPSNVTLRSSVDGYVADLGTITGMATSISTGNTITISGITNITTATTFRIYGYGATATAGTGGFDVATNVVNVELNGTTASIGPTSTKSGDWNDSTVWSTGSVPTNTDNVTVSVAHTVYSSTALTRTGTTTVNGGFELRAGGWASGTNFTYGATGTLIFNQSSGGNYDVNNGDVFWPTTNSPFNVTNSGQGLTMNSMTRTVNGTFQTAAGVNFSSSTLTINGIAQINAGGFFNQSPIYGNASTLIYNTGGTFGRGNEWQALGVGTIGTTPGYPNNIQLSGLTTLNYNNGTPLAKAINGNLTIDSGSNFYMNFDGGASGGVLTVKGNVTNNGNFTLGNTVGDDLKLGGNFTNTGTFNGNNRAVFFTKNGTQTVSSVTALTFPYVVYQPETGSTTIQLLSDVTVSAPIAGNAISFSSATDIFDLNGKTLTIGTAGLGNTILGSGSFKGSVTSNLTLFGTGSVGTLSFISNLNLGTLTMNRQAATVGCTMGSAVTINTALNLTNGLISLGNFDISLGLTATNTGSANGFVISDPDVGTGMLTKRVNTFGAYTLHIGENTAPNGTQYAPATINFSSGTFSTQAYYGIQVKDAIHPNMDSPTDYLSKYWIITSSGTFTAPIYSFTSLYTSGIADVNGTESNCVSAKWDGTKWTNGTAIGGGTLSISGLTTMATSTTNEISAGNRNREINIKGLTGGSNTIVSGSTTANGLNNTLFAVTNIGSSATKDYEIQNLGNAALNLTGTPIVSIGGTNPGDFAVTTVPSATLVGGSSTSFVITFSPTYAGIRTAIVSIANDDGNENPYTFLIQGTGVCTTTAINTITPTSGPAGTEVTITATSNNLTGATATFNGVAATSITNVSSTQIKVIVPSGATSGNLVTTNASGCTATNIFTVIDNKANTCQGGTVVSDLFISEVTDSNYGGLTYVEIYNGTGVTKNLSGYSINTASNGGAYSGSPLNLNNVLLTSGSTYIVALGDDDLCSSSGGNGSLATQVTTGLGINFDAYQTSPLKGNDHIALFNGATQIDSWGVFGNPSWATSTLSIFATETDGATFRRKNTAILPSTTYNNSDWDIIDYIGTKIGDCANNDYSDIGTYNFISGTPPTVTTHPSYTPTCKATSLTVAGIEGHPGGNSLTYKWLVSAPNATGWTELSDAGIYTGTLTETLSIADISGVIDYQYYCQIRENTNTCYTASNAVKITNGAVATWNGSWTNGPPTLDKLVIINADYDTSINGSYSACSVVVNAGKTVTITADEYVKIQNDLTNNGILNVHNNGSLVQVNDSGANSGYITYQRKSNSDRNTDYTYWSTPVSSTQTLLDLFPKTLDDMYYSYEVTSSSEDWKHENSATTMDIGKGYIVRGPEPNPPFPPSFPVASFMGSPNNGIHKISGIFQNKSYLIGNPYPSAINADKFLDDNADVLDGTLYFWTHNTAIQLATNITNGSAGSGLYAYTSDDYASYNGVGGAAASGGTIPTGKIAAAQGFFASSKVSIMGTNEIIFNNSMRLDNSNTIMGNTQFFKTISPKTKSANIEKHRIWLNLKNTQGAFKQTLIGYITNATNEYDSRFDGESFDANEFVDFYSINQDKNLVIQGRAIPFNENDEVLLGYRTTIEGAFTINIDQVDGVLTNQAVFIEDKLTNTLFDLKSGNYTFNTVAGTFNDRFVLRYTNKTLGANDFETLQNQVLVSNKNKQIKVISAIEIIDKVLVYDLLGRQIYKKDKVNSNELTLTNLISSKQTLLVKVSMQNGQTVTRKVVY